MSRAQALARYSPPTNATTTTAERPITECDGLYGSDNYPSGHNKTVPCGAYGCVCKYSPGSCHGGSEQVTS